jgi:ERCC4-type nuclease
MSTKDLNIQIIIDDREKHVIPFFEDYVMSKHYKTPNITHKVERVNIGDYSILCNGFIIFNIERKTWKDLASSIKDGRKNNVHKMIKLREETKSSQLPNGCQLMYLMEGPPIPKSTSRYGRIPYKNLRSHLDHIMFNYNIHVIHSKNKKGTVDRLYEICRNFLTITPNPIINIINNTVCDEPKDKSSVESKSLDSPQIKAKDLKSVNGGAIQQLKTKTPVSETAITYRIWSCIPNITEKTACLFINKDYHISDLILGKITQDDIYALKYENGYIIGKRASRIWNGSRILPKNEKYFVNMLSQITGVTKKTANIILVTISLEKLLKGEISIETLTNIKKNNDGRNIGKVVASRIHKFFAPLISETKLEII